MGAVTFALAVVVSLALVPLDQERKKLGKRDVRRLTQEADKLAAGNEPKEAAVRYKLIVESDPTNVSVALKLAKASEQLKDWDTATMAYTIASSNAKGAEQAEALAGLAIANARRGRFQEAIDSARKSLELNAAQAVAQVALAYGLVRTMAPDALSAAEKAVQLAATNAIAYATLGEALLRAGSLEEAEAAFRKALELDVTTADAHAGMARIFFRKGDHDATIASADKALELDKAIKTIYDVRGRAHYAKGNEAAAYTDLGMALTVNADDVESHLAFARLQRKQNNAPIATNHYRKVVSLEPTRAEAVIELAELVAPKGDAEAKELLQKAVALKTDWAGGHRLLGEIHEKEQNSDAALAAYTRAVELDPALTDVHYARGKLLKEKQDKAGALAAFEKALALAPDNAEYMTEVATLLYDAKQPDRVLPLLQKAAATEGYKNPMGYGVLGLALKDQKQYVESIAAFDKAAELAPKWWLPHWGAAWSIFGTFKKGCPCGADDKARLQQMKEHVEALARLERKDPQLEERVAILMKGEKVR